MTNQFSDEQYQENKGQHDDAYSTSTGTGETGTEESSERTYTKAEWDKRQSELDKRINGLEKQLEDANRKMTEASQMYAQETTKAQQATMDEQERIDLEAVKNDPNMTKRVQAFYNRAREVLKAEEQLAAKRSEIAKAHEIATAFELSEKYEINMQELLNTKTQGPQDMERKAMDMAHQKKLDELDEKKGKSKKYDSTIPSGKGMDIENMTEDELIRMGLEREDKNLSPKLK